MGEKTIGTDEKAFITILTQRSYPHLRAVADYYRHFADYTLQQALQTELSFNFAKATRSLLFYVIDPASFYAQRLQRALLGKWYRGSSTTVIIKVLAHRCRIDLKDIAYRYAELFKRSLVSDLRAHTRGNLRKLLLEIFQTDKNDPFIDARQLGSRSF